MADKKAKTIKNDLYKATKSYKTFVTNSGLMTEEQHDKLLNGDSVDLTGVPDKQMQYLLCNNLITK